MYIRVHPWFSYPFGHVFSLIYRVEKKWSKADHGKVPLENCHEMIQAPDGRLFLVTDHPKNNVLIYQTDGSLLVCTARIRNEFAWFTLTGEHKRTEYYPGAFLSRPVIRGENLYSAVCFGFRENDYRMWTGRGFIVILDKENKVISCPGGEAPRYEKSKLMPLMKQGDLVHNGHDVCVDSEENLYLCQWNSDKVPPCKLLRLP